MQVDAAAGGSRAAHVGDGLRQGETAASTKRESSGIRRPTSANETGELMQPPAREEQRPTEEMPSGMF